MERSSNFSITVAVIILALLGLFVGYLLGNWVIQVVTGDVPEAQQVVENTEEDNSDDNTIVEEEIVLEDDDTDDSMTYLNQEKTDNSLDTDESNSIKGQDVFVVQVGAFNNRQNALTLKQELEAKGFQAIVTEGVPYKVQLGATDNKSEAKETEKKIENLGYQAFITH
ncbi:MAG: SPOR domain-containing protein [Halothermotrichaceae bacterium]